MRVTKAEYYSLILNNWFWVGVIFALPLLMFLFALYYYFDNAISQFIFIASAVLFFIITPLFGLTSVILTFYCLAKKQFKSETVRHWWTIIMLVLYALLVFSIG